MFDDIIECSGIGAKAFLQGQLTCNVNDLKENQAQLSACCNLQGRVIFTTYVIMQNEHSFLLAIPESMKNIVVSHLEKYARFSKCVINDEQPRGGFELQNWPYNPTDNKTLILKGIPTIYPETSEQIIAQRLNLHLIPGAISFKKGCYLGQEIIARLHFKGQLKHHMILGEVPSSTSLLYGDHVLDDQGNRVGEIVDFFIENDRALILFVNAIDNKHPQLKSGQAITLC